VKSRRGVNERLGEFRARLVDDVGFLELPSERAINEPFKCVVRCLESAESKKRRKKVEATSTWILERQFAIGMYATKLFKFRSRINWLADQKSSYPSSPFQPLSNDNNSTVHTALETTLTSPRIDKTDQRSNFRLKTPPFKACHQRSGKNRWMEEDQHRPII